VTNTKRVAVFNRIKQLQEDVLNEFILAKLPVLAEDLGEQGREMPLGWVEASLWRQISCKCSSRQWDDREAWAWGRHFMV